LQNIPDIDVAKFLTADYLPVDLLEANSDKSDIDEAAELPKYITNYIGSKQKLIDWIWQNNTGRC